MSPDRQVYLLDPQKLKPETIAVTFAKTSRSPQSFSEIAAELTDEKSSEFHEKWVVGYGHSSVAEHAVLHIAVENISRLAVETLESCRLASYTEKSTRYQKWSSDLFFTPTEFACTPLYDLYTRTCQQLFHTYQRTLPAVREVIRAENPREPGESEAAWDRRIRSQYVDVCRFLLPAASLANVGMTINARALEHTLRKMLSHPLAEVNAVGQEIKQVTRAEVPTLIKYADAVPYLQNTSAALTSRAQASGIQVPGEEDWCRVVAFDPQAESRLLAAALYRFGEMSYDQAFADVQQASEEERKSLASDLLAGLGKFDIPLRELEHALYTVELTLDQGGFFELKRHRMMTLTTQPLTTHLGYALPKAIISAKMEDEYRQAMEAAAKAFTALAEINPHAASYIVPNAYNRRVLFSLNLRTAFHLIALRTAPNAHFSMRRAAYRLSENLAEISPILGAYFRSAPDATSQIIESDYFSQTF
jgi:thymidylate synthase ThyX